MGARAPPVAGHQRGAARHGARRSGGSSIGPGFAHRQDHVEATALIGPCRSPHRAGHERADRRIGRRRGPGGHDQRAGGQGASPSERPGTGLGLHRGKNGPAELEIDHLGQHVGLVRLGHDLDGGAAGRATPTRRPCGCGSHAGTAPRDPRSTGARPCLRRDGRRRAPRRGGDEPRGPPASARARRRRPRRCGRRQGRRAGRPTVRPGGGSRGRDARTRKRRRTSGK